MHMVNGLLLILFHSALCSGTFGTYNAKTPLHNCSRLESCIVVSSRGEFIYAHIACILGKLYKSKSGSQDLLMLQCQ